MIRHLTFARLSGRQPNHHVAVTRLRPRQTTAVHTHDFPEFFLVTRGRGSHLWNGEELLLGRGSFVFVRAVDVHSYVAGTDGNLEFVNVAIAPAWWDGFRGLFVPAFAPVAEVPDASPRVLDNPATTRLANQFYKLLERGSADQALLVETMSMVARQWLAPMPEATPAPGAADSAPEWLARVARDMRDPALVAQPLVFWQRHSGRSPEHLARSCQRHFGMSLSDLLNRARVEWVKVQLRRGEEKIAKLALDAGYRNIGYFYRVFRELEGCPPREWQKRHGGAATVPR